MVEIRFCVACSVKNEHRYKHTNFSIILMCTACDVVKHSERAIHVQFEIYSIIYAHCTHDSCFLIWYGRWISDNFIQCMDDEL